MPIHKLIAYWAKDIKVGFPNINAKAEGIESKPAFRKAFERRRRLVPVENFYEWRGKNGRATAQGRALGGQPLAGSLMPVSGRSTFPHCGATS
jgi:putative SOS response-associated peptidase YedK